MKKMILFTAVLLSLFCLHPAFAQVMDDESEGQAKVWTHNIDLVDKQVGRIVIGDRQFFYKRPVQVRGSSGKTLSVSALKPGLRVSVVPQVSNNISYVSEILVLGR